LQTPRLIPWRAHPDVTLLVGRQHHRHGFGMDRFDDGIRCSCQETTAAYVRPANCGLIATLWLWMAVSLESSVARLEVLPLDGIIRHGKPGWQNTVLTSSGATGIS
jgi:hypothetical protein